MHVWLTDGREVAPNLVGVDVGTEMAFLSFHAGRLPALHLTAAETVSVCDPIVGIDNPFWLAQLATAGIESARGRALDDDPYVDFLHTDAAINAGSSGGPAHSSDGTVIAVTSATISPNGSLAWLGRAIAAPAVGPISAQPVTTAAARALGATSAGGALVTGIDPEWPAVWMLGIGDVLLRLGSTPVTFKDLGKIAASIAPGTTIASVVLRDGAERSVSITTAQLPDAPPDQAAAGASDTSVPALEVSVGATTQENRRTVSADGEPGGLSVAQLRPTGPQSLGRPDGRRSRHPPRRAPPDGRGGPEDGFEVLAPAPATAARDPRRKTPVHCDAWHRRVRQRRNGLAARGPGSRLICGRSTWRNVRKIEDGYAPA